MLPEYEFDIKVGATLRRWRREAKISQDEMARKIGVTRQTIIQLEKGMVHPKYYTVYIWAEITNHDMESIVYEIKGIPDPRKVITTTVSGTFDITLDMSGSDTIFTVKRTKNKKGGI